MHKLFFGLAAALLLVPAVATAKQDAAQRTRDVIEAFKAVKPLPDDGSSLSDANRAANRKAFERLDGFFDFDRICKDPIKPHSKHFANGQAEQYLTTFRQLIRLVAYRGTGGFMRKAELSVGKAKASGAQRTVLVQATIADKDMESEISFHWAEKGGKWRLVDVGIDGGSLVRDYANQFGRILGKEGAKGLLERLEKRLKKELAKKAI